MTLEVFVTDEQSDNEVDLDRCAGLARDVLVAEGITGRAELNVAFVGREEIAALNERYLGHQGPTDVLSFPIEEPTSQSAISAPVGAEGPPRLLGDVVICPAVAAENAPRHTGGYVDELALLLVHGILHLLGMDHAEDEEAEAMEAREAALLACFAPAGATMVAVTFAAAFGATQGAMVGAVVILLAFSTVLALAETGLVRTTKARARALEEQGHHGARSLRRLSEAPERVLSAILLLVLICQLVTATLVSLLAERLFGALGVIVALVFEVVVISVAAEAIPKNWAILHSDQAALLSAPLLSAVIAFPPIRVVAAAISALTRLVVHDDDNSDPDVTESELLALADVAVDEDVIEHEERAIITAIIGFGDTIAREVMSPRPDMVAVERSTPIEEALETAMEVTVSRLPVFNQSVDDVVGIAHTVDLVRAVRSGRGARPVGELAHEPRFVPETKRVANLLREMQIDHFQLAIVLDEYGVTAGIVTLEDLIEELVGEIADEFDDVRPGVEAISPDEFRVSASMAVDDLNDALGLDLPTGDWDTIGGLVLHEKGGIPHEGDVLDVAGVHLVVERMQRHRVRVLRIVRTPAEAAPAERDSA